MTVAIIAVALACSLVALVGTLQDWPTWIRMPAALGLFTLAPGAAVLGSRSNRIGLVVALSLSISVLGAQLALWAGYAPGDLATILLVASCTPLLLFHGYRAVRHEDPVDRGVRAVAHLPRLPSGPVSPDTDFEPRYVAEIDVTKRMRGIRAPRRNNGGVYRLVRALVTADGEPIGFVSLELDKKGRISAVDMKRSIAEQLDVSTVVTRQRGRAQDPLARGLVTVAICTHNRADILGMAIESILAVDDDDFELLIVDNAPADARTAHVVAAIKDERVRYVLEPQASLARARNRAVVSARGEFVAFTDDDVRVDPRWITALRRGFARTANVGCVSGLVPAAELETPAQLYFDRRVNWSSYMQRRLFDLKDHRSRDPMYPYSAGRFGTGANFAVRTAAWMDLGGNDEVLGPGVMGEDLDFFLRVILGGYVLAYEPSAIVWHTHRTDAGALERQMDQYGIALAAYATKHLLTFKSGPSIVVKALPAMRHMNRDARRAADSTGLVVDLRQTEFRGMLRGPGRYLARRLERRLRGKRGLC